jgi:putative transposase
LTSREKVTAIEPEHPNLSIAAQCELLGLTRSLYYYEPAGESEYNLQLMNRLDELTTDYPFYGSRQLVNALALEGTLVNRKRIQRLMRLMGLETVYCRPKTSLPHPGHKIYPYLLRNVPITGVSHVWSIDITYIRMNHGFLYLVAIIDWFSRYVLSWELSNQMSVGFCLSALEDSWSFGIPNVFNSDQGSQFTSVEFTSALLSKGVKISMDGKGRAIDNVFIERLWRSLKYEEVYLKDYRSGAEAKKSIQKYFEFYNFKRPHQSLDGKTPATVFNAS